MALLPASAPGGNRLELTVDRSASARWSCTLADLACLLEQPGLPRLEEQE